MQPVSGDELADFFADLLRVPRDALSTSTNVLELGADSIMLLEARTWIEARHGRRIEISRFFGDLNTIDAIAAFLASEPPVACEAVPAAPAAEPGVAGVPAGHRGEGLGGLSLMRAQLALVAEVIEAQNRAMAALSRGPAASPAPRAAGGDDNPAAATARIGRPPLQEPETTLV